MRVNPETTHVGLSSGLHRERDLMSNDFPYEQASRAGATAAVVGCGAMGRGIVQLLAQAELKVLLFDAQAGAAEKARGTIGSDLDKLVARGKLDASKAAAMTA